MQEETITVLINGEPFETIINTLSIQVFRPDAGITFLAQRAGVTVPELLGAARKNELTIGSLKTLLRGMGYSLYGYAEKFPEDKIENPLWDD